MAEQSNYVDLRINVNGQIHNVKVQKGVSFGQKAFYEKSIWTCLENGVVATEEIPYKEDDRSYDSIVSLSDTKKEIKMSETEFALFRNIANNVNEGGILTLSDKDITEAQNKYEMGKFTNDISQNLPAGYSADKSDQKKLYEGVKASAHKKDQSLIVSMTFKKSTDEDNLTKTIKQLADKSKDGKVKLGYAEGGLQGMGYTGKDGKIYHCNPDGSQYMVEYKDSDGKIVYEYGEKDNIENIRKEWTENGKSIIEITDYRYPDNNRREEVYVNDKGKNVFDVYKNNVLKSRLLKYTLNGKHFEEKYENGKLTSKTCRYSTEGNDSDYYNASEIYDNEGRLSERYVDDHTWKYIYNDKGERELLYEIVPLVYKESGKPAGSRIKKYGAQIDLNYRINNVKTFAGLDIEKNKKVESSEKVKKYKKEFHYEGAETIAATIKNQIDGFSRNDKTLAMVDAIPEDKAIAVLKYYKELSSFWGKEKPLFVALDEEMGIGKEEIMPIMRRFCAIYLGQKNNADEITKEDVELAKKIQAGCQNGEDFTQYMKDIDALLTR